MRLPRFFVLAVGISAALAMAVPATAETHQLHEQVPDQGESYRGNPVEDCLPDEDAQPDDVDEAQVAECILDALPDIVGSTHAANVIAIVRNGIATGFGDGTFRPEADVTRGQMATALSLALDVEPSENAELPDDVPPDSAHAHGIAAILEGEIAQGRADGSFGPHETVSRGHLATMLANALELVGENTDELPEDARGSVHAEAIAALLGEQIVVGYEDGTFRPAENVNRGHMATYIAGALGL